VEFSPDLVADLASLTAALGRPETDLQTVIEQLADQMLAAVPSFAGLSVAVSPGEDRFTASAVVGPGSVEPILASVRLTLGDAGEPGVATSIVFYAHTAGAMVDLAADLRWALGLKSEAFSFDDGSPQEMPEPGSSGLDGLSQVHRGIGILVDQGFEPGEADDELTRLGEVAGTSRLAAAEALVRRVTTRHDPPAA